MKINKNWSIIFFITFSFLSLSCSTDGKKKIVYINSYHRGHPSSDEIMDGFIKNMPADSFEIYSWYMDTKRNLSEEYMVKKAEQLFDSIIQVNPDVLVVSDDNAVKYIVNEYLRDLSMPVIFCGVNWTDREYNLPKERVTGILEILPVEDAVGIIKSGYPTIEKLMVLNENTTTSRKEVQILDTLFQRSGIVSTFKLVDDFEQWKEAFKTGSDNFDLIYISTHAAIKGWDKEEAMKFVDENIKVPVFTCEDFMMPYAVLGVTKIASEHGIWAANCAKQILAGADPATIPVSKNRQSAVWLNKKLAKKIDFRFVPGNNENVKIINE